MPITHSPAQRQVTAEIVQKIASMFWRNVDLATQPDGCWLWTGGVTGRGYGNYHLPETVSPTGGDLSVGAHRVAWMLGNNRDIPDGLVVDHICHVKRCCRPTHLQVVTQAVNGARERGIRCSEPRPYISSAGVTTWKVRHRKRLPDGVIRNGSTTFPTEAEAWSFVEDNRWRTSGG